MDFFLGREKKLNEFKWEIQCIEIESNFGRRKHRGDDHLF